MKCRLVSAALLLVLAGCATHPVSVARSRPVKARRLLPDYALYSHPVPYGAKLVVIRDTAKLDTLERVELQVDGRGVAVLQTNERLDLYVYAGDRLLGLNSTPGFLDSPEIGHPFYFKSGQTYYLRIGVIGHSLDIRPAAPM